MSSYSGTITTGIVLTNPATQNPATVTAGGYVTNTTTAQQGVAVYGNNAAAWNFTNYGTINATSTASVGLALKFGGNVTNAAGALIAGIETGVYLRGDIRSLANSGTESSAPPCTVTVSFLAGSAASTIRGLIEGGGGGIGLSSVGTVTNSGTIAGNVAGGVGLLLRKRRQHGADRGGQLEGVYLRLSGTVTNSGTIAATGTSGRGGFTGAVVIGSLEGVVGGAPTTIRNNGIITGYTGIVVNSFGTAPSTIVNYGTAIAGFGRARRSALAPATISW